MTDLLLIYVCNGLNFFFFSDWLSSKNTTTNLNFISFFNILINTSQYTFLLSLNLFLSISNTRFLHHTLAFYSYIIFSIWAKYLYFNTSKFFYKLLDANICLFYFYFFCLFHACLFHSFYSIYINTIFFAWFSIFFNITFWSQAYMILYIIILIRYHMLSKHILWMTSIY